MDEKQYFLLIGKGYWINPFNGNITHAYLSTDFDGNSTLEIHFVSGEFLRFRANSLEAMDLIEWLNNESINVSKRNEAVREVYKS